MIAYTGHSPINATSREQLDSSDQHLLASGTESSAPGEDGV